MIVRAIDASGDWLFGKGSNDFLSGVNAVSQSIQTRLRSFLGDCFFDVSAGVDWFGLLGSKNRLALSLAVKTVILNTENVTRLIEVSSIVDLKRNWTVTYSVQTVFGVLEGTVQSA